MAGSGPAAGSRIPVPEAEPRGSTSIALPGSPFSVGDEIILAQQDSSPGLALVRHLYRDQPGDLSRFGNARVQQVFRVRGTEGGRLLLDRPLRFDVRPEWEANVARFEPGTTDVGIERLAFEFPEERYAGHWQEVGYNPVAFSGGTAHCWMREVRILNADNGPFVNGFFSTVEGLVIEAGRRRASDADTTGHHGVTLGGGDLLCTGLRMETRFFHDVTVTRGSVGNVFSKIEAVDFNMDHHRAAPYENLFTDIDAGDGGRLFGSGGAAGRGRHTAAGATFWNIRTRQNVAWPEGFGPDAINLVALRMRERAVTDPDGRWIEPIRPGAVDPPDLHLAMLEHRLRREGRTPPQDVSAAEGGAAPETAVETHRWESADGRAIEARYGGMEGGAVILVREGQSFRVPLEQLSEASRELARRLEAVVVAQRPFTHPAGGVARVFQHLREGEILGPQGDLAVAAEVGVPGMVAGEEDAARGQAGGGAGVVLGEAHPALGHRVEPRGADELLPVAAEVAVAEVVGEDVDEVGRALSGKRGDREGNGGGSGAEPGGGGEAEAGGRGERGHGSGRKARSPPV